MFIGHKIIRKKKTACIAYYPKLALMTSSFPDFVLLVEKWVAIRKVVSCLCLSVCCVDQASYLQSALFLLHRAQAKSASLVESHAHNGRLCV